jgi:tetratricopeptide (TPR) repeat protein
MQPSKAKFSCAELIERAQQVAAGGNVELATQFLRKAMEQDPENLEALEGLGELLMEQGLVEEAKEAFLKSIAVSPQDSGGKFMYLAQLQQGPDALERFQQGLGLLKRDLDSITSVSNSIVASDHRVVMLKRQLCTGFCSVAELWMSDLCFELNAEQQCDAALQAALEYGPENPEALQAMASFRISQHRSDDASKLMDQALAKLQIFHSNDKDSDEDDDMMQITTSGPNDAAAAAAAAEPPFEFRVQTARLLLELNRPKDSVPVLERLLREDDDVLEVWVLLAQAYMYKGGDFDVVDECLTRAQEMLGSFLVVDPNDEHFSLQQKRLTTMRTELAGLRKTQQNEGVGGGGGVAMEAES